MHAREIRRDEWVAFCESFSRQHDGWLTTVEVPGTTPDESVEPRVWALVRVSVDRGDQNEESISIVARDESQDHMTHTIKAPMHLRLMETEEGAHEGLEFQSKDGQTTIMRFRSPILPELVDGVTPD